MLTSFWFTGFVIGPAGVNGDSGCRFAPFSIVPSGNIALHVLQLDKLVRLLSKQAAKGVLEFVFSFFYAGIQVEAGFE
ncbi:hypothetical protein RHMOL_RhmolMtG0006300 (mitochondrion) [Rhododendron molle]|nr:hypothetical protein RHMOL_RhmolMtG0006300 [Rhododendron molle]